MKKFELNGMGESWIYEAHSEQDATLKYLDDIIGSNDERQYIDYCESIGVDSRIEWKEIE